MKKKYNWTNHLFNFLAVILGVYLAFFMNEKAKENQERKESVILMNSLFGDLSKDIQHLEEYQIPINIQHQQNLEILLNTLFSHRLNSLDNQLSVVMHVENFAPSSATYNSMKVSGKLGLIDDLTLQKQLTEFYDGLAIETVRKSDYQVDYFTEELLYWLTNNVDMTRVELSNKDDLTVFRNKLLVYSSLVEQKIKSYEMVVEDSRKLKLKIESLLESR